MSEKIRTVIADDEPLARTVLRDLLSREADFELVGEASNGEEALGLVESLKPDLAILDIRMPGPSGIELLRRLEHRPLVVFATAYEAHAVTAFELEAVDYLLKPFGRRRFAKAAQRIRETLEATNALNSVRERTGSAMRGGASLARLMVRERGRLIPLAVAEIQHIRACDDYAELHARGRTYLVSVRMKHLMERLDKTAFVRIHRSYIANIACITEIRLIESGRAEAILSDGSSLPVSRSGLALLRTADRGTP